MEYLSLTDCVFLPFVLFLIYYYARVKRNRNIEKYPEFKYYVPGLTAKVVGAIAIALIYSIYYSGGDTLNYYHDGLCMNKLLFSNPQGFYQIFKEGANINNLFYFSPDTGYPVYWRDKQTYLVTRFTFFTELISFRSFIVSSVLFSWFSFLGIWRLYRVFLYEFPHLAKQMAIAVLFIPSVFFWGSGMLKDSVTFSAVGFFTFNFYLLFVRRQGMFLHLIGLILSTYVIISIKPYIFFALLAGSLIWIINNMLTGLGGSFTRAAAAPVFFLIAFITGYLLLMNMSSQMGQYSLDNVLYKAVESQQDLKAEYYHGNTFDIGEFDPTIPSMLSKAHLAINAALFRPYIWETKNAVMIMSGIENLFILLFPIIVLFRVKFLGILRFFFKHHLLTFSLVFSLFFAFSVGLTTPNFGSMVRYRIPILPFYVASLFIIQYYYKQEAAERDNLIKLELAQG